MPKYGKNDLDLFEKNIHQKLERANEQLELLLANKNSSTNQSENASNGSGDLSMLNQQKEVTQALVEKFERKVRDLKAAKHRVENGTYGVCEVSHELISVGRLLAFPAARKAVDEKRRLTNRLNTKRSISKT